MVFLQSLLLTFNPRRSCLNKWHLSRLGGASNVLVKLMCYYTMDPLHMCHNFQYFFPFYHIRTVYFSSSTLNGVDLIIRDGVFRGNDLYLVRILHLLADEQCAVYFGLLKTTSKLGHISSVCSTFICFFYIYIMNRHRYRVLCLFFITQLYK